MATQFVCSNTHRRNLVLASASLNGIDFLEVLDDPTDVLATPPQRTLLLHFLKAAPVLTPGQIVFTGGVRVTSINCTWVSPADSLSSPPATASEAAYAAALENAAKVLVIRTDAAGDFSRYTLSLVSSAEDGTPPASIDARLAAVDFSFKVSSPSDFDCASTAVYAPAGVAAPLIDYLAKDYASFRRLMLDRLAVTMPAWQERNPADLGIALVETMAFAADRLSYFQDAVATEAYLATARRRVSVRRHAVLLDYSMHEGVNARAWVFLELDAATGSLLLPGPSVDGLGRRQPGTLLLTRTAAPAGALTAEEQRTALAQGSRAFETMADSKLEFAHNEMQFYTWSDDACCLPAGSTAATLRNGSGAGALQLAVGDAVLFEEVLSPLTGEAIDADPSHRCVVRLTSVVYGSDPLDGTAVAEIGWAAADALPFALFLSASLAGEGGSATIPDVSVARGNLVLADHGLTIAAEALEPAIVPATGLYRPRLDNTGVTFATAYDAAQPAALALTQDPRAALPAITLGTVDNAESTWLAARDLLESGRFDTSFVLETEEDGSATLRFGDGQLGALPESGLEASYRVGNGSMGNVGRGAIQCISPVGSGGATAPVQGIVSLRNPLPAQGGIDPEPTEQVRLHAPRAFRTQKRAVTEADYAAVAAQYPQVRKAVANLRWTGSWYTMFVTVDRAGGLAVDRAFSAGLTRYLESFRLAGYDVEVESPVYAPLDIALSVCVLPSYFRSKVEAALYRRFSNGLLPGGAAAFFHPDNLTFGQAVYLSRIVSAAMEVPGVQWVDTNDTGGRPNHFRRYGRAAQGETAAGRIAIGPLEIARLDNDPGAAENGRIEFLMGGGL